jgi:hypothetical protein
MGTETVTRVIAVDSRDREQEHAQQQECTLHEEVEVEMQTHALLPKTLISSYP